MKKYTGLYATALCFMLLGAAHARAQEAVGIAAVVDDQAISSLDLSERLALVMGTTGITDTPETRAKLAPQILRQLIDEKLQTEEAAKLSITVSDERVQQGVAQIEKQNGKAPGNLMEFLGSHGLSKQSFLAQIRGQILWSEIVLKKIRPRIRISDQEVSRYVTRKATSPTGATEALIAMIRLPVDAPANDASIHKLADKLAKEIRAGASFEAMAGQFSSSAGNTKAADPFWVETTQIDPLIAPVLAKTAKGDITDPVRTAYGYQIVKLFDLRRKAAAPEAPAAPAPRAELAFKQILMTLKPDAQHKEAELLLQLAQEVQKSPGRCEEKSMAGAGDLAALDFDVSFTRSRSDELSEKLRDLLMKLPVGAASEPVITPQGIRLFMLCERIDLPEGKTNADTDAVRQAIYQEKLELEAQKYLRNLRRDAFVEVRLH